MYVLLTPRKNSELSDYKNKVGELRSENDYQLRLKDMNYGEKIKEMKDTHTHDMEKLRSQYEVCQHHTSQISLLCPLYSVQTHLFTQNMAFVNSHSHTEKHYTTESFGSY